MMPPPGALDTPSGPAAEFSTLLRSAGVPHGFSTRAGGVSRAPYASLNLGDGVEDDPENVAENFRRFRAVCGFAPNQPVVTLNQVHGREVHVLDTPRAGTAGKPAIRAGEGDAIVSAHAGAVIGVRTADCVPILMYDPATGAVAAVHAGWRGVLAGVVAAALARMAGLRSAAPGGKPPLLAAVGPCIGLEGFEVGPEVAQAFTAAGWAGPEYQSSGQNGRFHVALRAVVQAQIMRAWAGGAQIEQVGGCTWSDRDRYFSFRRDGPNSGRMLAAIACP